jgi:hypothetical protein
VVGAGGLHPPVLAIATLSSGEDPDVAATASRVRLVDGAKRGFGESTVRFGASTVKGRRQRAEGRAPTKKRPRFLRPYCPSWARTRTLLIQSPLAQADISDNLLGFGHFPSIGARIPAVVCPLVPGETTSNYGGPG